MSVENKSFEIIMNKNDTFLMIHHTKLALMFNTITMKGDLKIIHYLVLNIKTN